MADDFLTSLFAVLARDLVKLRLVRPVFIASPAAGAEWSFVVPGGVTWEVIAVRAAFVTSAVVATRIPELDFTDADAKILGRIPPPATQVASTSTNILWNRGFGDHLNSGGISGAALPFDLPLSSGYTLRSNTFAIDVGDQWSAIVLFVREWDVTALMQEVEELDEQFQAYLSRRAG